METDIITNYLFPTALFVIMFGLGLTLTIKDFRNIFIHPKAVLIGSITQLVFLPLLGIGVAYLLLDNSPELAVGLILLSSCPGGPTSNLFTHLGNGDIALCLTLTAISSCVKIFTIPLIVNLALNLFMHVDQTLQLEVGHSILKIFSMTIIPALIGIAVRAFFPTFADKAQKPLKIISILFLAAAVTVAAIHERNKIFDFLMIAGPAALVLNLSGMTIGYITPRLFRLTTKEQVTISIETSIQNGALAIAIATSPLMLNNTTMAMPAVVYSIIMFFTALVFITIINKRTKADKLKTG